MTYENKYYTVSILYNNVDSSFMLKIHDKDRNYYEQFTFYSLKELTIMLKHYYYPEDIIERLNKYVNKSECYLVNSSSICDFGQDICKDIAEILLSHKSNIGKVCTYIPYEDCDHLLYQYGKIIDSSIRKYKIKLKTYDTTTSYDKNDIKFGIKV